MTVKQMRKKVEKALKDRGYPDVKFSDEAVEFWLFINQTVEQTVQRFIEIIDVDTTMIGDSQQSIYGFAE